MIKVFECGQGDSAYIEELNLLVDLGEKEISPIFPNDKIDVMVTHSHSDHIMGVKLANYSINKLFMPAYLPECLAILNKLRERKLYVYNQNIELVYEGKKLYQNKITVLNPPLDPWNYWNKVNAVTSDDVNSMLSELGFSDVTFLDDFNSELNNYYPFINNDSLTEADSNYNPEEFIKNLLKVIAYYYKSTRNIDKAVYSFLYEDANILSIIFSYTNLGCTYLFTGDANKAQFKRINNINSNALVCDFLKVPHHGSKYSLDTAILQMMQPKIAVVSHNNRYFGNSKDCHPNQEVVDLFFPNSNIRLYSTNDIIKPGINTIPKHVGKIPGFDVVIE